MPGGGSKIKWRETKMANDDDEFLVKGGQYPALLTGVSEVSATCVACEMFFAFNRWNLRLTLSVFEPSELEGVKLYCFAPIRQSWRKKGIPTGAKLGKMLVVATGKRKIPAITRKGLTAAFVHKAFKCRVRVTGTDVKYSVVDMILDVLAG